MTKTKPSCMLEKGMTTFGKRLRRQRERRGLTQKQLAEEAGVPQETISRLETGTHKGPHIDVAVRLARTLGVTLDFLAGMYEGEESEVEPAEMAAV